MLSSSSRQQEGEGQGLSGPCSMVEAREEGLSSRQIGAGAPWAADRLRRALLGTGVGPGVSRKNQGSADRPVLRELGWELTTLILGEGRQ